MNKPLYIKVLLFNIIIGTACAGKSSDESELSVDDIEPREEIVDFGMGPKGTHKKLRDLTDDQGVKYLELLESDPSESRINSITYTDQSFISDINNLIVTNEAINSGNFTKDNLSNVCNTPLDQLIPKEEVTGEDGNLQAFLKKWKINGSNFAKMSQKSIQPEPEYSYINEEYESFMVRQYSIDDFESFKNEITILYKLKPSYIGEETHFASYAGCKREGDFLYVFTFEKECFIPLSSYGAIKMLKGIKGKKLKNLYINITKLVVELHNKNFTHGFLTMDNILINHNMDKFKLKNFKYAANHNGTITNDTIKVNPIMNAINERTSQIDLKYNDIINVVALYMFLDIKVFNNFYMGKFYNFDSQNKYTEFLSSMLRSSSSLIKSLRNTVTQCRQECLSPPKKNILDHISDFISNVCCAGSRDKNIGKIYVQPGYESFDDLHNLYIGILNLDKEDVLRLNLVCIINKINYKNFSTWIDPQILPLDVQEPELDFDKNHDNLEMNFIYI